MRVDAGSYEESSWTRWWHGVCPHVDLRRLRIPGEDRLCRGKVPGRARNPRQRKYLPGYLTGS
jgi:hypothetical protein